MLSSSCSLKSLQFESRPSDSGKVTENSLATTQRSASQPLVVGRRAPELLQQRYFHIAETVRGLRSCSSTASTTSAASTATHMWKILCTHTNFWGESAFTRRYTAAPISVFSPHTIIIFLKVSPLARNENDCILNFVQECIS